MSGETIKLVKVEDVELRQLQHHKSRACSNHPDAVKKQIEAERQKTRAEFQQQIAALAKRTQRQAKQTTELKSNLANIEKNAAARLQQQQQQLQAQLQRAQAQQPVATPAKNNTSFAEQRAQFLNNTTAAREEYNRIAQAQAQQFQQIITQECQERQQQVQVLQQELQKAASQIQEQKQQHQKLAQDLLSDVQTIWSDIQQNYQHQRFAPGRLEALHRQIDLIRSNIQAGIVEAAIANAQQTYLSLSDLRLELEQKEQEFLLLHNSALEEVRAALVEAQAHRQCRIEIDQTETNEVLAIDLDVDYWSQGRLSQYEQQLRQLESQLTASREALAKEQVQAIAQQMATLQPRLAEIVEQARLALLSSQMRADIAETVVDALSSLGYTLVNPDTDAIYEGDDQRQAYVIKVKNMAGDEVVTVISPEKEFGTNSVSINAFSESLIDETAAQQNAKAVFDVLEAAGIQGMGQIQCNRQARAEYRNLQQVKQRRKTR